MIETLRTITLFSIELVVVFVIGRMITARFRIHHGLQISLAPLIGLYALALQLGIYGMFSVSWSVVSLLFPWVIIGLLQYKLLLPTFIKDVRRVTAALRRPHHRSFIQVFLILAIIGGIATYVLTLTHTPLIHSDTLVIWAYKTKVYFEHQQVFTDTYLLNSPDNGLFFHVGYPPLFPLTADVGYVLFNGIREGLFKLVTIIYMVSAIATFVVVMKRHIAQTYALVGSLLIILMPQFAPALMQVRWMGYADVAFSMAVLAAVVMLIESWKSNNAHDAAVSIFLAAMAATLKNEGLSILTLVLAVCALRLSVNYQGRRRLRAMIELLVVSAISIIPLMLWGYYRSKYYVRAEFDFGMLFEGRAIVWNRLSTIIDAIVSMIKGLPEQWWLFFAGIYGTVVAIIKRSSDALIVFSIAGIQLGSYVLAYITNPQWANNLTEYVVFSFERLLLQIAPLVVLGMCLLLQRSHRTRQKSA